MRHRQVLPLLCPLQAETAVVGSQHGFPCGSIGMVATERASCWWFSGQPSFHTLQSQGPITMKRSCWTILNKTRSWRGVVFRGTSVDLLGTKVPVAAFLLRMWLTVARVRPTRPSVALCCMPSRGNASTSCLIPIGLSPCHWGGMLPSLSFLCISQATTTSPVEICHVWPEMSEVRYSTLVISMDTIIYRAVMMLTLGVKSLRYSLTNTTCVFWMMEPTPIWNLKPSMRVNQSQL